jgi:choline dehydrogenase
MRPKSRGFVRLRSNDFNAKPIIHANLLSVEEDLEDLCDSIRITIDILNSKAFEPHRKRHINFDNSLMFDDNALKAWVRHHVESAYHYSGTCAMGSVTDNQGRVKGVKNLRICDASIMPFVPSGNTNAPTIMMAEKIADHIKDEILPPSNVKYFINPNWETSKI